MVESLNMDVRFSAVARVPTATEHTTDLHLLTRAHLRGCFSNPRRPVKTLIRTVLKGSAGRLLRIQAAQHHDNRGPVAKYSRGPQTGLSAASRSALVAGYAAGVPVKELEANVAAIEQAAIQASCETRLLVGSLRRRNTTTEQESLIRAHGGRFVYLAHATVWQLLCDRDLRQL